MVDSKITFVKGLPTFTGSPPYRLAPTVANAEALLKLPPVGAISSIAGILTKINPIDLRKLMTVIDTDKALRAQYEDLQYRFCGIASPGAVSWPVPKTDEILDEFELVMGIVRGMVFTIDGHRLIACHHDGMPKLLTIEEFKLVVGDDVENVVKEAAKNSAQAIRKFAAYCVSRPVTYEVSMISNDFQVVTKTLIAYSRDQIDRYAKRTKQTVTDVEEKNQ